MSWRSLAMPSNKSIENYYFDMPKKIDRERKIVFMRAGEIDRKDTCVSFFDHEVFAGDEMEKSDGLVRLFASRGSVPRPMQHSGTVNKKTTSASGFLRILLRDALIVFVGSKTADENGGPLSSFQGAHRGKNF